MASESNGSNFLWFLAGAAVGAAIATLYAPQSGRETRRYIRRKSEEGREARLATIFIRPHQLQIDLEASGAHTFRARVEHVNPAGPLVKVDLIAEWGDPVRVEMSQERFRALTLSRGDSVFVSPVDMRLFPE